MEPIRNMLKTALNLPEKPAPSAPSPCLPSPVRRAFLDILGDLDDMPSGSKRQVIDDLDRDLYREALQGIRSLADMEAVRREVRRQCEFRPCPARFREIVEDVIGETAAALPGHALMARRVVTAPTRLLVDHGDNPARARARQTVAGLRADLASRCREQDQAAAWLAALTDAQRATLTAEVGAEVDALEIPPGRLRDKTIASRLEARAIAVVREKGAGDE